MRLFNTNGVPIDDYGLRQPLLANFNSSDLIVKSARVSEIFESLPTCEGGLKARNTNTPEEFMEIQHFLMQDDL